MAHTANAQTTAEKPGRARQTVFLIALIALSIAGASAEDQPRGMISGVVVDAASRAALAGANITVDGTPYGAAADSMGQFTLGGLPDGSYTIQVSLLGYSTTIVKDVLVAKGSRVSLEVPLSQSVLALENVEILAVRPAFSSPPEMPLSRHELQASELRSVARGLNDPLRSLSIMPGVAQTKIDRNDLVVRGGSPGENLIVIDNVEFSSISHFSMQGSASGSSSVIDLELIEGATLSAGGFGVRYGDKSSAVIDFRLRDPRNDHFTFRPNISVTQLGIAAEGPLAGNASMLLSVRRSYLDKVFEAYGFGFVPAFWDGLMKITLPIGGTDKVTMLAVGSFDTFTLLNSSDENRYQNSRMMFTDQGRITAALSWQRVLPTGSITFSGSATLNRYKYYQHDANLQPTFSYNATEHEVTVKGDAVFMVSPGVEFAGGISAKLVALDGSVSSLRSSSMYGEPLPRLAAALDTSGHKGAWYLQLTGTAGPLSVTAGVRADYFGLLHNPLAIAPRVSGRLELTEALSLKAAFGRYYQAPPLLWFTASPINMMLPHLGADHLIAGAEIIVRSDFLVGVEAYSKRYFGYPASVNRTYLVMSNTGSGLGGSLEGYASFGIDSLLGLGSGHSRGVEVFVQKKLSESPWYGLLSITYGKSEFRGLDGVSRPASYDQPWILAAACGFQTKSGWDFGLKFRYYAGRPYTSFGGSIRDHYSDSRVSDNHALDVSVSRTWSFRSWNLTTYLNVLNAYNRRPLDAPIYSERNRREEQAPALGVVPTLGISAEF